MSKKYINETLRKEITSNIRKAVRDKVEKSIPGKELGALKRKIETELRKAVRKECPMKDLNVLRKYGLTTSYGYFYFSITKKGVIDDHRFYTSSSNIVKINFKKPIEAQDPSYSNHLHSIAHDNDAIRALCQEAYKTNRHLECEILETTGAYVSRIAKYRTVSSLLKKYPTMEKYIPKETGPTAPVEPSRADKLIKQFEET